MRQPCRLVCCSTAACVLLHSMSRRVLIHTAWHSLHQVTQLSLHTQLWHLLLIHHRHEVRCPDMFQVTLHVIQNVISMNYSPYIHLPAVSEHMLLVHCSLYAERQQLNNAILALLTDNAAAMESVDTLWQRQQYPTPHARANIVYADQQLQPPSERPKSIKLEDVKQEPATKQAGNAQTGQQMLPALLGKLEGNLAKELCHISEQDHVTMTQLLKPVQVS